MKKRNRSLLFYTAVIIFLILSPMVALFALGYDYDFVHYKLIKTGSLRLTVNVASQVYINNKYQGDTKFLSDSFSQGRMLPQTYIVRVQNPDYQAWLKFIDIQPSVFSDFPKIVLVPQKIPELRVASSSFSALASISFDKDKLLATTIVADTAQPKNTRYIEKREVFDLQTGSVSLSSQIKLSPRIRTMTNASALRLASHSVDSPDQAKRLTYTDHEIRVLWLEDANHQPFQKKGDSKVIMRSPAQIIDAQWYKDSEHFIANVGGVLKLIEIDDRGGINSFDLASVSGPFFYDKNSNYIYKFNGPILVKLKI